MQFRQFYLNCLAHASYLIGSEGEAAVVDPQRDVEQYLAEAERQGLKIRYVLETHLHADFVSGHRELAQRTGAEIVFGHRAGAEFPHRAVRDGDELHVGRVTLRAMETPGHTPESICWLVVDPDGTRKVLTGDTLFIGDVGRPDLAGSKGFTAADMAGLLYDSLHGKLLRLDDEVEVYPAHGAGSACGRNISRETSSTIGEQRRINYALRPMTREQFVELMTTDLPLAPRYFPMDAELNRRGARPLAQLTAPQLDAAEVRELMDCGATVLDVRDSRSFAAGHLPGAVNIGLKGSYASWSGSLLDPDRMLIVVAEGQAQAEEAVMRLARVGLERVGGWLDFASWTFEVATLPQLTVGELQEQLDRLEVLDVRAPSEFSAGHVPGAKNVPLAELQSRTVEVDPGTPTAVICAGGYRSAAAASILQREGYGRLYDVIGGTTAWVGAGLPTER